VKKQHFPNKVLTGGTTDVTSFEAGLRKLMETQQSIVGADKQLRPFVCAGNPLECEAFIIGTNPATPMRGNWWNYLDKKTGYFDKTKFEDDYKKQRNDQDKSDSSNTRGRINLAVTAALPVRCLETNVYSIATPDEDDLEEVVDGLEASNKNIDLTVILKYLIESIHPKIVLAHGGIAKKFFPYEKYPSFKVNTSHHFGYRKFTNAQASACGRLMRDFCKNGDVE